ncbi:hypothetical protein [Paraburkholderia sp.]|uniref:fimbrial protein n=1 Tax=Paraburkholderia sp. TaxID=1926495 RepID=UPI002D2C69C3|nr:hypothetical protein [Paraburkholderia sp.]HZZ01658.1 hypothetical protein [Paraburkholderia sp.]
MKTGPIAAGATIPAEVLGAYLFGGLEGLRITFNSSVTITQPACSTPNVTVNMGTPGTSAFKAVGSRVSTTSFAIKLNNCPTGDKLDRLSIRRSDERHQHLLLGRRVE